MAFDIGSVNFNNYKVEIMSVLLLVSVGYWAWATYKKMTFRAD